MKHAKFLTILNAFTDFDWRLCSKYIRKHHERSINELGLYSYFYKRKEQQPFEFNPKDDHLKIYKNKSYISFQNIAYRLSVILEGYLADHQLNLEASIAIKNKLLAEAYRSRGLYKEQHEIIHETLEQYSDETVIDLFQDFHRFEMYHSLFFNKYSDARINSARYLSLADLMLSRFYENINLFYKSIRINTRNVKSGSQPQKILGNSLSVNTLDFLKNLSMLAENKSNGSFNYLKKELLYNSLKINSELKAFVLIILMNHCFFQIKKTDKSINWIDNLSELYKYGLDERILLYQGKLTESTFLNIIDVYSKTNMTTNEIELFVNNWILKVNTRHGDTIKMISLASLHFSRYNYEKCLECINKANIKKDQVSLTMRMRWYFLGCVSQDENYENKDHVLNSVKAYFVRNRKSFSESIYRGSLSYIKIVEMIWKKVPNEIIRKHYESCNFMVMKYWVEFQIKK